MYNFGSFGVLETMSLALRTVWLVLGLGLGLEAQVRAIGIVWPGRQCHECCCLADTLPLNTRTPPEAINDYYRACCEMDLMVGRPSMSPVYIGSDGPPVLTAYEAGRHSTWSTAAFLHQTLPVVSVSVLSPFFNCCSTCLGQSAWWCFCGVSTIQYTLSNAYI